MPDREGSVIRMGQINNLLTDERRISVQSPISY